MKSQLNTTYLKNNFLPVLVMVISIWISLLTSCIILKSSYIFYVFLAFPLFLEICLRIFMFLKFGSNYKYSILFFSLVSDKNLGYRFRKNISTPEYALKIHDQFLNRWFFERPNFKNNNLIDFHTDEMGFRGNGFDPNIKSARMRIFCCGGSTTACNSVNDENTWPKILEKELINLGYDVEVINAGVQGWHSYQDLKIIQSEIVDYKPDLILLHQGWNEEFEYSSQNLGKWWKPKTARNEIEENLLYLPKNKILSQKFSLFVLLCIRALSWKYLFKRNMSFLNAERWKCLLSDRYLTAWFENQIEIAKVANQKDFLLFNLDYPCLVNITDSEIERSLILNNERFNSRLDNDYADYQAISKQGISHFIEDLSPLIPSINGGVLFDNFEVEERIKQFGDEVHFSTLGCKNYGEEIARQLSKHPDFLRRYKGEIIQSNIKFQNIDLVAILKKSTKLKKYLNTLITRKIIGLESLDTKRIDNNSIPDERYSTF